jgi:pimeloyl-ACP methyl ester carboxylesterase
MPTLLVQGHELEYVSMPPPVADRPTLVFLHEGLGSLGQWRDFPQQLAEMTGCGALVYSRYGYGNSDVLAEARIVDYMHVEAQQVLPDLLGKLHISNPILVGHSDGASIALIYAGSGFAVRALILEAPHLFVEDISIRGITDAKQVFKTTDLPQRLGRYHRDAAKTFWGWNDIWLAPAFRAWNIEEFLPRIGCPILAIQGADDEYGSMAQIETIAKAAKRCELLKLENCRHAPHRDQAETVLTAMSTFVRAILTGDDTSAALAQRRAG